MPDFQADLFASSTKPAMERHRLFFAVMPDDQTRAAISNAAALVEQQHAAIQPRWIRPERYHATLNFLGEFPVYPDDIVMQAMSAGHQLKATSFDWTLDYIASFRGSQPPCVLRSTVVPELFAALSQSLNVALIRAGLRDQVERQFTPHVTLAYGRRQLPEPIVIAPITWRVERLVLIYNAIGKGGYRLLGSWPFG